MKNILLITLIAVLVPYTVYSQEQKQCIDPTVTIVDSGFYEARKGKQNKSENIVSGYTTTVYGKTLITKNIPTKARLNLNFGFRYNLTCTNDLSRVPVTIKVEHPLITNPNTETSGRESFWNDRAWTYDTNYHTGWEMVYPWEVVAGEYTISLIINEKVLAQEKFDVTQ